MEMLADVILESQLGGQSHTKESIGARLSICMKKVESGGLMNGRSLMEINKSVLSLFRETREAVTASDLQAERKTLFESAMAKKEEEFAAAMRVQAPEMPKFADDDTDRPIGEENISKLLANEVSKRQLVGEGDEDATPRDEEAREPILSLEERVKQLEEKVKRLEETLGATRVT